MTLPSLYSTEKVEALRDTLFAHPAHFTRGELRHFFVPGVYARELFMPAGTVVVGKVHKRDHLLLVLGECHIVSPEGVQRFEGYNIFEVKAGTQRNIHAIDDTWLVTFHSNPDDVRDVVELENRFTTANMHAVKELAA